jgi:hypothetical protein
MRLLEIDGLTLYHGDDFGTTRIEPKLMFHGGNNQEGVGIYFSPDIKAAKGYGSKIIKLVLTKAQRKRIVPARDSTADHISPKAGFNLLKYIHQNDDEFWYLISNYMEVTEPEDVNAFHLRQLFKMMAPSEIRNFQIEVCQGTNVELFVKAWNATVPINGLHEIGSDFYSIINPEFSVTPVNF